MKVQFETIESIKIHKDLISAAEKMLIGTGITAERFWKELSNIVADLAPKNKTLLKKRDVFQEQIDEWHRKRKGKEFDLESYKEFLSEIGYIEPISKPFKVSTINVDESIKTPGPQLVVPIDNPRYALNAANSRWVSLLNAFYGTNAGPPEINGAEIGQKYNPIRGAKVFEYAQNFMDKHFPLENGSYNDIVKYKFENKNLILQKSDGNITTLKNSDQFVGYNSNQDTLNSIFLKNNNLHLEIQFSTNGINSTHPASISEILLESALSCIMDCEDSVAAVDAQDKVNVYMNWAKLMNGSLTSVFKRKDKEITRKLNADKNFITPSGEQSSLNGRAIMLVRTVGLHLQSNACFTKDNESVPENILDVMMLALGALPDLKAVNELKNSYCKSMYIVRPKMHGSEEVAFSVELFGRVEKALGLPQNTLKIGIMDEERRTTVNLYNCMVKAKDRVIFINTGFLDRTGDEIHTSFEAGPMLRKSDIKNAPWRIAYENWNVDVGIAAGLQGKGQIGKGMWAKPDELGEMLRTKGAHPKSGATTAWVPSPTAACLHAIHYHETSVTEVQKELASRGPRAKLDDILRPSIMPPYSLTRDEIQNEIKSNAQSILGYVVRWIQLGVGCSKVPDIDGIGLMEDRATLRISSQHIANWIHHGICTKEEVVSLMKEMASLVDDQNIKTNSMYMPMSPGFNGNAWKAAIELVFDGKTCANGLTEFGLIKWRRLEKEHLA